MAELLLGTQLTPEQREFLDALRTSARAQLEVISDVLDFSKIEAGLMEKDEQDVDLFELVHESIDVVTAAAENKGLDLSAEIGVRVPSHVRADGRALRQILVNLLGNALKFTPEGEVVLSVEVLKEKTPELWLSFNVTDTGIGITPEQMSRIFEPFVQADSSISRRFGGTGLGLPISRRLAEFLGGRLEVSCPPGGGTTFALQLPLTTSVHAIAFPRLEGTVLVLAASERRQRFLSSQLEAWGLTVVENMDAPAAIGLIETGFQGADLAELTGQLRERGMRIVVVRPRRSRSAVSSDAEFGRPARERQLHKCLSTLLAGRAWVPADAPYRRVLLPSSARILVAEDNPINQQLMERLLSKRGASVTVASNGREAVDAFGSSRFDIVFMDIQMPEMDGLAATREIRRIEGGRFPRTPLIALTAHASREDREQCLSAGMDGYLSKPLKFEELDRTLARWIPAEVKEPVPPEPQPVDSLDQEALGELRRIVSPDGDMEFWTALTADLSRDADVFVSGILEAAGRRDLEAVRRLARGFKSIARSLGLKAVRATCQEIEGITEPQLADLAQTLERLREELRDSTTLFEGISSQSRVSPRENQFPGHLPLS
jgi:CheY-like chemotaxis protein